jgi:hypothetical protein
MCLVCSFLPWVLLVQGSLWSWYFHKLPEGL